MLFPSLPCEEGWPFDLCGQGDGNTSLLEASGDASALLTQPLPNLLSVLNTDVTSQVGQRESI